MNCKFCKADCAHRGEERDRVCMGYIAMTNADRIRAMSDEELVKMLWKTGRNYRAVCADPVVDFNEYHDDLLDWLQQSAGEEDKHETD